ncbi:hypothetical protein GIB67_031732 [Kingdonia uniflora]|uniref:Uncharacterized protein n=1 Tax=Kingdonia uniflora TaxID=39325 RepID=A0A7J7NJU4_9MAGN|nr:hypothetical protein GIB67_031732 [Kingdonia uniflora]
MGNIDLFGFSTLRFGITLVVVTSAEVHSVSQDFVLPDLEMGPDLRWNIEWTGRRDDPHPPLEGATSGTSFLRLRGVIKPESGYAANRPYKFYAGSPDDHIVD